MFCSASLWGGLRKNKRGVVLFQISQKERLFHPLWQPSTLWSNLTMCSPFLDPPKRPSYPLQFGREENIPGHSIKRRAYWFVLKTARVFPIPTSRNKMINNFIIVTIIPDKSMLVHSKNTFLLLSVWSRKEHTSALIWKKNLLNRFENYQGIPCSHTGRVDRGRWTLY